MAVVLNFVARTLGIVGVSYNLTLTGPRAKRGGGGARENWLDSDFRVLYPLTTANVAFSPAERTLSPEFAASRPMPRKTSPSAKTASTASEPSDSKRAPTLATLRADIDRIDKELIGLLNKRAGVSLQIGQVKAKQGMAA